MMMPCCCGCAASPSPVPRFVNSTRVVDYAVTANPDGILPYGRPWPSSCACSPSDADCSLDAGNNPGQPVCYTRGFDKTLPPENNPDFVPGVLPCASGGGLVSQVVQNCFTHDGSTMLEFPSHCTYGWKGVQAYYPWRGRYGFVDSGCCDNELPTSQTKYATISYNCISTQKIVINDPESPRTVTGLLDWKQICSVDHLGNIKRVGHRNAIQTDSAVSDPPPEWNDSCRGEVDFYNFSTETLNLFLGAAIADGTCGIMTFGALTGTPQEIMDSIPEQEPILFDCEGNSIPALEVLSGSSKPSISMTNETIEITRSFTTRRNYYNEGCEVVWSIEHTTDFQLTVSLSNPLAFSDVVRDAEELLAEWPLDDDRIYPWRTDSKTWLMPLVTRDVGGASPTISWSVDDDCLFESTNNFTGEYKGAPLPVGYGRYFDFHYLNECAAIDGGWCSACPDSLGATSPDELPLGATQWPIKSVGASMPGRGAHVSQMFCPEYGSAASDPCAPVDSVYVQKWAETLVEWPAYNLARPCGRDRYLFDETAVAFVNSFIAPDLILETVPAVEFTVGDKVVLNDGGVYQIATKTSATIYTVGAKLYDSPIDCDGASKLRFPTTRALCSTLAVSCVQTSPGLITCTTPRKHWLKAGGSELDTLTFVGVGGLTTAAATVVTETSFTVAGTLTTSPSSGTISDGATAGQIAFDTTCARHTFLTRNSQSNYRGAALDGEPSVVVTTSQHSLAPNTRHPTVLYCTPNGESFPHGYQHPWGSIASDLCFGEKWGMRFEQAVPDPLWQADHRPQSHPSGTWEQAANPCDTLDEDHYAFPPLVETLITTPPGAPDPIIPLTDAEEDIQGVVSHPNCEIEPYLTPFEMSWRPGWLTCTDWQELIGHKC